MGRKRQSQQFNLPYVRQRLAEIDTIKADYEAAHTQVDVLFLEFIRHVRRTGTLAQRRLASAVLKAEELDFPRHTA